MLSICKYFLLNEQRMDMDTIRHARKRFLMARGIGKGTAVAGPEVIPALNPPQHQPLLKRPFQQLLDQLR